MKDNLVMLHGLLRGACAQTLSLPSFRLSRPITVQVVLCTRIRFVLNHAHFYLLRERTQRREGQTEHDLGPREEKLVFVTLSFCQLWDEDHDGDERVVDVHIGQIRKKIETRTDQPELIRTVRGVGYKFEAPAKSESTSAAATAASRHF